jgi:hypothetical protein
MSFVKIDPWTQRMEIKSILANHLTFCDNMAMCILFSLLDSKHYTKDHFQYLISY